MVAWRNCTTSIVLIGQVNARWPGRDKASDGTIGDAAHATRNSDHNPWVIVDGLGVVRARDIDKDGVDIGWMFEELRKLGAQGDPRLAGGGYLIWNRRITTPDFTKWVPYNGSNPHDKHGHVSFSRNRAGFDSPGAYGFFGQPVGVAPPPAPPAAVGGVVGDRFAKKGERGADVVFVQQRLNVWGISCNVDADFGDKTEEGVREFQRIHRLGIDGIVGPQTWAALERNPAPPKQARPTLRRGSKGDAVGVVQERLATRYPSYRHEHGVLKVDNDFGAKTEAWVKEFQGRVGLKPDGIVGEKTYKALGL